MQSFCSWMNVLEERSHFINVSWVLGLLLEAKRKGLISAVKPVMDRLINEVEFRVSSQLYTIILQSAGE